MAWPGSWRWGAAMVALLAGCGGEDGILLEVTTKVPDLTIEKLSFTVGVARPDIGTNRFVVDEASTGTVQSVDVSGRDLSKQPYRLLLRDNLPADAAITVAVRALAGQRAVAFADMPATEFIPGRLLVVRVELDPLRSAEQTDSGCLKWVRGDDVIAIGSAQDQDCDGDLSPADCADTNPQIGPSSQEICPNGIDDNCIDGVDEIRNDDNDPVTNCAGDCNDLNQNQYPGNAEACDGVDNDCNDLCDDGFDGDGDHVTTCGSVISDEGGCSDVVVEIPDCNDGDPAIVPGADDVCDGLDNDCDGTCDTGLDADGDGFTLCGTMPVPPLLGACGVAEALNDCRPDDDMVRPLNHEICDGKDDSCDGLRESAEPCYALVDGGATCRIGTRLCDDDASDGSSGLAQACVVPVEGFAVPATLCSAYAGCDPGSLEPWRCANATHALKRLSCIVRYQRTGELCSNRSYGLDGLGLGGTSCAVSIQGGTPQEHYTMALLETQVSSPAAEIAVCNGLFVVAGTTEPIPQPDQAVLFYRNETFPTGQRQPIVITITPQLVPACSGTGMECMLEL